MFIKLYFTALSFYFVCDLLWVGLIAKSFYHSQIGFLMRETPVWWAIILFYLVFAVGLVVFVIHPALQIGSLGKALMLGALFGLMTYGTYDLINLALTENWPLLVTGVDLLWGIFLCSFVSVATYLIAQRFWL
jgi:uncharacterized membrane protein